MKNLLTAILILLASLAEAQNRDEINSMDTAGPSVNEEMLNIPPIDSLFKWAAANSYQVKQQEALMEKNAADTRRVKKKWMDVVKVNANARAGNYGNSTINQVETGYSFGPFISFSFYELFSQKDLVAVYKAEEKVSSWKKEEILLETNKMIIYFYNQLQSQKEMLKVWNDGLNAAYVHLKMAEKEFNEGAVAIGELSRVTEIYTKAQTDKIRTLSEMKTTYMQLQQICGKNF